LVEEGGRGGHAEFRAGQAARVQERREHHAGPEGVDTDRRASSQQPLGPAVGLDLRDDALDPLVEPTTKTSVEVGGGEPQAGRFGEHPTDGRGVGPGRSRPSCRLRDLESRDREQVLRGGGADLGHRRAGGPQHHRDGAADLDDPLREEPRDLVCANERLPVPERLLAEERAPGELPLECSKARLVRPIRDPPERLAIDRLVLGVVGDLVEALTETRQRARQRTHRQFEAGVSVLPKATDLLEDRLDGGGFQPIACQGERALAHGDDPTG
jgi:hypothetical protein